ncbi:hypothetical protein QJS04_geneDACA007273 [Acorus gramineus]|uniref:Uncharacterized protein n=1 Tax=Acorus gramineus TaxID=55184 RepID=A0AAV9BP14_ACOGR|nr:hypothetical protein QJS04_geneDACA007273 [Acorus gramineus]
MEEMETESSPPSTKHLAIKNTIQTNFGDDYVFQIASRSPSMASFPSNSSPFSLNPRLTSCCFSQETSALAVSLSTNAIKFYSAGTGQYVGECTGHSGTINDVSFSVPSSPHVLSSCSSDGTIRAWDTRTFKQVSLLRAGPSQEVYSFSFGGPSGNLLAAGCGSEIRFWDWRIGKQMFCLEDSHVDDVTQVHFTPNDQSKLISGSVDGLMCVFDADGDINDDNHLESVMNVGTSISKIGFFGQMNQKLWCLTHIETLRDLNKIDPSASHDSFNKDKVEIFFKTITRFSVEATPVLRIFGTRCVWDWNDARNEANFEDARSLASDNWNRDHIDYFVDCHYSGSDDLLWVIGGTNAGTLGYFPVIYEGSKGIGSPEAILEGGHAGVVRTVLPVSSTRERLSQGRGIFSWTGGEDGLLSHLQILETSNRKQTDSGEDPPVVPDGGGASSTLTGSKSGNNQGRYNIYVHPENEVYC